MTNRPKRALIIRHWKPFPGFDVSVQVLGLEDVAVSDLGKWNPPMLAGTPYVVQGAIHVLRGLLDAKPGWLNSYFRLFVPIPIHVTSSHLQQSPLLPESSNRPHRLHDEHQPIRLWISTTEVSCNRPGIPSCACASTTNRSVPSIRLTIAFVWSGVRIVTISYLHKFTPLRIPAFRPENIWQVRIGGLVRIGRNFLKRWKAGFLRRTGHVPAESNRGPCTARSVRRSSLLGNFVEL